MKQGLFIDRFEILVYGDLKENFIEDIILPSQRYNKIEQAVKKNTIKGEKDSSQLEKLLNISKSYSKKVLQIIFQDTQQEDQQKQVQQQKGGIQPKQQSSLNQNFLNFEDFQRIQSTISDNNFWFTFNFNLISEILIDPYMQTFSVGMNNLVILVFNNENDTDVLKTLSIFNKIANNVQPSQLKFKSQMMLLQYGYQQFQSLSDQIRVMLATRDNQELEKIGPCLLISYGKNTTRKEIIELQFEDEFSLCEIVHMNKTNPLQNLQQIYFWILKTNYYLNNHLKLGEEFKNKFFKSVEQTIQQTSIFSTNKFCNIF